MARVRQKELDASEVLDATLPQLHSIAQSAKPHSESDQDVIRSVLFSYVLQHNIKLYFLEAQERRALIGILTNALHQKRLNLENPATLAELDSWKAALKRAAGISEAEFQQELAVASAPSVVEVIAQTGFSTVRTLATDSDIRNALNGTMTDPRHISADSPQHTYVLSPISLTETAPLEGAIREVMTQIAAEDISAPVTVLIPGNKNNGHWQRARLRISQKQVVSADIWDPLSAGSMSPTNPAEQNLADAINTATATQVTVQTQYAGVQHNSTMCGDYVTQHIMREAGVTNTITAAATPRQLRNAFARTAAINAGTDIPAASPQATAPSTPTSVKRSPRAQHSTRSAKPIARQKQCSFDDTLQQICFDEILAAVYSNKLRDIDSKLNDGEAFSDDQMQSFLEASRKEAADLVSLSLKEGTCRTEAGGFDTQPSPFISSF